MLVKGIVYSPKENNLSLEQLSCSVANVGEVERRFEPCCFFVERGQMGNEGVHLLLLDEGDRAAAEATACHPATNDAVELLGVLGQCVQFKATYFVQLFQRAVRGVHQLAEQREVARLEGGDGFMHTGVFIHGVLGTITNYRILDKSFRGLKLFFREFAQVGDGIFLRQNLRCFLTLSATVIVLLSWPGRLK